MLYNPKVGQRVALSRLGYSRLRLDTPEAHEDAKSMVIISVQNIGGECELIWDIRVNSAHINKYMLDHTMFNLLDGE